MANNNITLKINLVDDATGGIKSVVAELENATDVTKQLTQNVKDAGGWLDKMANKVFKFNQLADALRGVSDVIGQITAPAVDFERAMRKANTMAGLGAEEFADMKNSIHDLSKEIPLAKDMLANGLYQTISNGVPKDNWIDFLNKSAHSAVGGVADLEQVVTVTSTVIKNYGLAWNSAGLIQDKIQKTAQNGVTSFEQMAAALPRVSGNAATLGVSIDELLASFATLTGVSGNTAEVSTQMAAVFTALVKPTSEATKQAEAMGIQFNAAAIKAAGGLAPFLQNLDKTITAYSVKTGELKQTIYANLFGSAESLRALVPLTGELAGKFNENIVAMADSAGTMDFAFAQNAGTAESWAQTIRNKVSIVGDVIQSFMGNSLPALQFTVSTLQMITQIAPAASLVGKAIETTSKFIVSHWGAMVKFVRTGVVNIVLRMNILKYSIRSAGGMFNFLKISAVTSLKAIGTAIKSVPVVGWVIAIVSVVITAITVCWNKFAGFRAFLITTWDTIKQFGNIIKEFVIDRIYGIIEGLGSVGSAIAKLFKGDFSGAWEEAKSGVRKLSGAEAVNNALKSSKEVVNGIGQSYATNLAAEQAKGKKTETDSHADFAMSDIQALGGFVPQNISAGGSGTGAALDGIGSTAKSENAGKIRNINVTIDRVVEHFTVQTTNLKEDAHRIKEMVSEVLVSAINDINLAV